MSFRILLNIEKIIAHKKREFYKKIIPPLSERFWKEFFIQRKLSKSDLVSLLLSELKKDLFPGYPRRMVCSSFPVEEQRRIMLYGSSIPDEIFVYKRKIHLLFTWGSGIKFRAIYTHETLIDSKVIIISFI